MIKAELIGRIYAQDTQLGRRGAENAVNAVLATITAALARGDRVEIRGFGMFSVRHRLARTARNPRSGAAVAVEERGRPYFRCAKEMHKRLNKPAA